MNGVIDSALKLYARLDVETAVSGASPEALILMLYDGALRALAQARAAMEQGDAATKGRQLSKAIGIIEEGLRSALDPHRGGDIAENLAGLYEYMGLRLMQANVRNDLSMVDEVSHLLRELKGAWETAVARQGIPPSKDETVPAGTSRGSYGKV